MAVYTGQSTPINNLNEIMEELVEPLAQQALFDVPSDNPLFEVFEREAIDTGAEIEEILIGDANVEEYDKDGKTTLTPRKTNVIARYYNDYDHPVYTTTIYRDEIRKVSIDPNKAPELAAKLLSSLAYTRDEDTFVKEKQVLADMVEKYPSLKAGTIAAGTKSEMGEELTEMIRNLIDNLMFKNQNYIPYNADIDAGVLEGADKIKQKAYFDRIRIIMPYNVKNAINIGYLANVYNLDKTELLEKIVTIDTTDGIVFVIDKFSVFRYPQLDEISGQENAEGRFRNEFLHVNQMIGASTLFKFAYIDASELVSAE